MILLQSVINSCRRQIHRLVAHERQGLASVPATVDSVTLIKQYVSSTQCSIIEFAMESVQASPSC